MEVLRRLNKFNPDELRGKRFAVEIIAHGGITLIVLVDVGSDDIYIIGEIN